MNGTHDDGPHWFSEIVGNNPPSMGWAERIRRNNPTARPPGLNPTQEQEDDEANWRGFGDEDLTD